MKIRTKRVPNDKRSLTACKGINKVISGLPRPMMKQALSGVVIFDEEEK